MRCCGSRRYPSSASFECKNWSSSSIMSLSHASRVDTLCFSLPALGEREKSYFSSSFRTSSEKSSVKEKNLPYCYSYFYFFLLSSMYLCSCHFFFNSVPISLLTREREKILLDILGIEKFSI